MKKLIITTAIILGLSMTTFADPNNHHGGLFQKGAEPREYASNRNDGAPMLPAHNQNSDADAPLGTGIALLTSLGAAYLVGKKRREE